MTNDFFRNIPRYNDDSDFTTNANSYYDDLARKNKLIQMLAEKIWKYENTLKESLESIEKRLTDYIAENDQVLADMLQKWDDRIANLDKEVSHIFVEWLNDGTLEEIINHDVLGNKADKTYVDDLNENVTAQLAHTEHKLLSVGVSIVEFPRFALEVIDDFRLMRAHDALKEGGTLFLSNEELQLSSVVFTKKVKVIGQNTILKLRDSETNSDFILDLKGDYSSIEGVILDGNKIKTTGNIGRAEGLRTTGNHISVRKVIAKDNGERPNAHLFANMGDYNNFEQCLAFNGGYAGFSNQSASYTEYEKCSSFGHKYKGFRHQGNSEKLTLSNCLSTTESQEIATDSFLFDSGIGNKLQRLVLINCMSGGTAKSNSIKCINVEQVEISGCDFESEGSKYGLNLQEGVVRASVRDTNVKGVVNIGKETDVFSFNNLNVEGVPTEIININMKGKTLTGNNLFMSGADKGIRTENLHVSGKQRINLEGIEFDGSSAEATLINPISFLGTNHIRLNNYLIVNGKKDDLTGVGKYNKQLNISPRTFFDTNIPTQGNFLTGDIVYNQNLAPGTPLGWVCVTQGEPGIWKSIGNVGA